MKNFNPMGMIPEFNAWGNHPNDMEAFVMEKVKALYTKIGLGRHEVAEQLLLTALDALSVKSDTFTGHYIPCNNTKPVSNWLLNTFVENEKCQLFGVKNYKNALNLMNEGHNVLAIMNHATALDCLISESLTSLLRPKSVTHSYIASQVFEYARIAGMITSGFDKFPIFQPKHIQRMDELCPNKIVIEEMRRQNKITLRALCQNASDGGRIIFLFPEKNRSPIMGVPEPIVARIPSLIQKASGKELYILPTYVSGGETIFPNVPGTNELDNFLQNLRVGHGNMYCGEPIAFSKVNSTLSLIDKTELVEGTLGKVSTYDTNIDLTALSILLLGSIATLSPFEETKGIYNNEYVKRAVTALRN
jgi:1-acyl-sn-glycerol-3-phosphate acyltransferase